MGVYRLLDLFKDTFWEWLGDNSQKLGASLAFYMALSIAPLIVVAVAIGGWVFGPEAARGQIVWQIDEVVGREGARFIETLLENAYNPGAGLLATAIGLFTLFFGASAVFAELRDSLDTIWRVRPPYRGIFAEVKNRFFSFAMVLCAGFLLLVSLLISAAFAAAGRYFGDRLPLPVELIEAGNIAGILVFVTVLFAAIYKVVPHARIAWGDVWIGAATTAVLFGFGKFLIGMYLGRAGIGSAYGAAGSLLAFLVWVYYSAQIFYFGAKFTQVYANRYGSHVTARIIAPDQRAA